MKAVMNISLSERVRVKIMIISLVLHQDLFRNNSINPGEMNWVYILKPKVMK